MEEGELSVLDGGGAGVMESRDQRGDLSPVTPPTEIGEDELREPGDGGSEAEPERSHDR